MAQPSFPKVVSQQGVEKTLSLPFLVEKLRALPSHQNFPLLLMR